MSDCEPDSAATVAAFTIHGITSEGRKFRPSDWSCRLAGPYGTVVGNVVRYHPDVQPVVGDNYPGVRVRSNDPTIIGCLEAFAVANDLVIERS